MGSIDLSLELTYAVIFWLFEIVVYNHRIVTHPNWPVSRIVYAPIASGTKFFVVCETGAPNMEMLLKVIYELYTDFVLKNPFYEMEMPIRCELFDHNLAQVIQKDRVALLGR